MSKKKHTLLLGAHMSIATDLACAIERGESIGCTTIQIFTKSNRQWAAKPFTEKSILSFKSALKNSFIQSVVAHASYLINIGSSNALIEKKSIEALKDELLRCSQLEIPYLVLHPGSRGDQGEKECLDKMARNLNAILNSGTIKTKILLETMAGQGNSICRSFEQLAYIIDLIDDKAKIGVCLDTCHVFAAGYDLRDEQSYAKMWQTFDTVIGLHNLYVIHINDSKKELSSRVDRHENIGKGKLGLDAFRLLFNDPRFFDTPKILETPKESLSDDLRNMHTIESLLSEKTRQVLEIRIAKNNEAESK